MVFTDLPVFTRVCQQRQEQVVKTVKLRFLFRLLNLQELVTITTKNALSFYLQK